MVHRARAVEVTAPWLFASPEDQKRFGSIKKLACDAFGTAGKLEFPAGWAETESNLTESEGHIIVDAIQLLTIE